MRFPIVRNQKILRLRCKICLIAKRQRTIVVEHTINPFNRNTDGSAKNREQISKDVDAELATKVMAHRSHFICIGCENKMDYVERCRYHKVLIINSKTNKGTHD
jgi:hypothetical protein